MAHLLSLKAFTQEIRNDEILPYKNFSIFVSNGVKFQKLKWSIAGNSQGRDPNILSELIWTKLRGPIIEGMLQWKFKSIYLSSNVSKSFITSGKVTDTDYSEDNRKGPTYWGSFNSNKGGGISLDGTVGYFILRNKCFYFNAHIGYGINQQTLYILDEKKISQGLQSTYETNWKGPLGGVTIDVIIGKLSLQSTLNYHQVRYLAEADWNLVDTFQHPVSFKHKAKGYGMELMQSIKYPFSSRWFIIIQGQYSNWQTGKGIDQLFKSDGQIVNTQLNGVESKNGSITVGINYTYNN